MDSIPDKIHPSRSRKFLPEEKLAKEGKKKAAAQVKHSEVAHKALYTSTQKPKEEIDRARIHYAKNKRPLEEIAAVPMQAKRLKTAEESYSKQPPTYDEGSLVGYDWESSGSGDSPRDEQMLFSAFDISLEVPLETLQDANEMLFAMDKVINSTSMRKLLGKKSHKVTWQQHQIVNFDLIGKLEPEIKVVGSLGQGIAKKVNLAVMKTLEGKAKFVALATQPQRSISTEQALSWLQDLRIAQRIETIPGSKAWMPKILYAGMRAGSIVMVSTLATAGAARDILPLLTAGGRLKVLLDYGRQLALLHREGICHNDTAMRNFLLKWPAEVVNRSAAIGRKLAKPLADSKGRLLARAGQKVTPELYAQIKQAKIKKVKICTDEVPIGVLSDLGSASIVGEPIDLLSPVTAAIDCSAPERYLALNIFKKAQLRYAESMQTLQGVPGSKKALEQAAQQLAKYSTPQADCFSYGQMILDVLLRPDLDTSMTAGNDRYREQIRLRGIARCRNLQAVAEGEMQNLASAIETEDYQQLHIISAELAEMLYKMLSYSPAERPALGAVFALLEQQLERLIQEEAISK